MPISWGWHVDQMQEWSFSGPDLSRSPMSAGTKHTWKAWHYSWSAESLLSDFFTSFDKLAFRFPSVCPQTVFPNHLLGSWVQCAYGDVELSHPDPPGLSLACRSLCSSPQFRTSFWYPPCADSCLCFPLKSRWWLHSYPPHPARDFSGLWEEHVISCPWPAPVICLRLFQTSRKQERSQK